MKKIFSLLIVLLAASVVMVAKDDGAKITFAETSHDFGTIKSTKGPVSHEFKLTNTGKAPLVIISVTNGGCGCTTPSFTKAPIPPGKTGYVKITFNPTGRKGEFNREVSVKSNAGKRVKLRFSGVIVP